jgi:hypothetical protein
VLLQRIIHRAGYIFAAAPLPKLATDAVMLPDPGVINENEIFVGLINRDSRTSVRAVLHANSVACHYRV